jgi:hypothetical protein
VNDSARVLLAAAVLSAGAFGVLGAQVDRLDLGTPQRLIGQMRLAQWAALLLAASCGLSLGFIAANATGPAVGFDATLAVVLMGVALMGMQREPRQALLTLIAAFVAHALVTIAHRPGWLPADAYPRWYAVGAAAYDTVIGAVCAWTWRR